MAETSLRVEILRVPEVIRSGDSFFIIKGQSTLKNGMVIEDGAELIIEDAATLIMEDN